MSIHLRWSRSHTGTLLLFAETPMVIPWGIKPGARVTFLHNSIPVKMCENFTFTGPSFTAAINELISLPSLVLLLNELQKKLLRLY